MTAQKLDLPRYLHRLRDSEYVIVKSPPRPDYLQGSDVDIFCRDRTGIARRILAAGQPDVESGYEIDLVPHERGDGLFIDFRRDGALELRFDLYDRLPAYRKVDLKPSMFAAVLADRTPVEWRLAGEPFPVYVVSPVDDVLLRHVEYLEWYALRPDKVKHLEYIESALRSEPERIRYLERLHAFTALPARARALDGMMHALAQRLAPFARRAVRRAKMGLLRVLPEPWRERLRALKRSVFGSET